MRLQSQRPSIGALALGVTVLAAALAAGVALGTGVSRADAVLPTLYVNYTMTCTFAITDDAGRLVTSIPPGTYQVDVESPVDFGSIDLAGIYDMTACKGSAQFQLNGPGVTLLTTLDDGDSDFAQLSATFQPGSTYVAQDGNQPTVAPATIVTLTTGSPTTITTTTTSGTTTTTTGHSGNGGVERPRGSLAGTIDVSGKATLRFKGKAVSSLAAGSYRLTVTDISTKHGFAIQQGRKRARTVSGAGFIGKQELTIDLLPGQWGFYATPGGKKTPFVVTS